LEALETTGVSALSHPQNILKLILDLFGSHLILTTHQQGNKMKTSQKIKLAYQWNWRAQYIKGTWGKEVSAFLDEFFGIFKNILAAFQGILWSVFFITVGPFWFLYSMIFEPVFAGFKMTNEVAPKVKKMLDDVKKSS
jgi:hypothetical protein